MAYRGGVRSVINDNSKRLFKSAEQNGELLGPTIRVRRGESLEVTLKNSLVKPSSLHWHGLRVGPEADVMPPKGLAHGEQYTARFTVDQPAASLWYHPHLHMDVGRQQYRGLSAFFIIDDLESDRLAAAGMPHDYGVDDVPLIIQDLRYDDNGRLIYVQDDFDQDGMLGDQTAINGTHRPVFKVTRSLVRFRLLNSSTSRPYKIGLSNRQTFLQVASDGGFLEKPVETSFVSLSPSERAEIVVDFSKARTGMIQLVSYAFAPLIENEAHDTEIPGENELSEAWKNGPRHRSRSADDNDNVKKHRPPPGFGFALVRFEIPTNLPSQRPIPQTLVSVPKADVSRAVNLASPRLFKLEGPATDSPANTDHFDYAATINSIKVDHTLERVDQHVKQNTQEVWDIRNDAEDMMHPFHVHAGSFRVISRNGRPVPPVEQGLKDSVQTFPGETVRILVDFSQPKGKYFFHCHVLEHEDMGMMGILGVE
jgi:blue copper oxidase